MSYAVNVTKVPTPHDYKMVQRTDTKEYTKFEVAEEFYEWVDIVSKLLGQKPVVPIVYVVINPRLTSTLAKVKSSGVLEVSQNYLQKHSDPKFFHSTLCHEAIHTFKNCWNHSSYFKQVGNLVSRAGFNVVIGRTGGDINYALSMTERAEESYHYKAMCEKCKASNLYKRKSADMIKNPSRYRCKCGGKVRAYQLCDDGTEVEIVTVRI